MLPGIGFTELMVLAIAALIIVGPKDLPMMMRRLGQFVGKGRAMAREFQAAFDDIARQSELQELRKEIEDLKLKNSLKEATDDLSSYEKDVNSAVMAQTAASTAEPAKPEPEPEPEPASQPETEPKGDPA
jgi:sec-independent protein translocase protein TatB